jgi:hypothetical protein
MEPYRQRHGEYRAERRKLLEEYGVPRLQPEWEDGLRYAFANPGKRTDWDAAFDPFSKQIDHSIRILHTDPAQRTEREQDAMTDYCVKAAGGIFGKKRYDELRWKDLQGKLTELSAKYPRLSLAMTLIESNERHSTHIRIRGDYKQKGIEVTPGTPGALPGQAADRLALARWLVSPENPLTARVAVNRFWQQLFGRGLVGTPEDFGTQGEKPTHPELLDLLARDFMGNGWSMKRLIRQIVTSSTYRQSSDARPDLAAIDPDNRLLARQARFRLPAELIRDSVLQAGNLLTKGIGGESIRPPQPEGVAEQAYSYKWVETTDQSRYRRGLYVHVQRTALYPLLMNFDAPDRVVSCSRREISNTPLQALNLMNDPVFAEAARALSSRLLKEANREKDRIERAFELCYSRKPTAKERDLVSSHLDRRRKLARGQSGERDAEAAAWFGVSRALLNSDEFLTRE